MKIYYFLDIDKLKKGFYLNIKPLFDLFPSSVKNYLDNIKDNNKLKISALSYFLLWLIIYKEYKIKLLPEIKFINKPRFKDDFPCYFNISHSYNAIAIAISLKEVGVDIEKNRKIDQKLIKYFLSEEEINNTNPLEYFTKKEAVLKCLDKGILLHDKLKNCLKMTDELVRISTIYLKNYEYILSACEIKS